MKLIRKEENLKDCNEQINELRQLDNNLSVILLINKHK